MEPNTPSPSSAAKPSSITTIHHHTKTPEEQFKMPTWGLMVALLVTLVVLKAFIYIKDPKRDAR